MWAVWCILSEVKDSSGSAMLALNINYDTMFFSGALGADVGKAGSITKWPVIGKRS